ncbi:protein-L-isoaspartate O-methyltransferase family protein [Aliikangiella coralliicola]|uniref:Protein-L-isoaspartate O-methyltransferase n=1 Tax=Aliikangiella coralliicola TaxID=2592383 RepID=A0A545UBZ5_9GAMM|nr:protein-L-isoaspartate O-methyltransferase [Aliikangiella coralliicola]TQV86989.1 protein-L-isoaspartate O-methyltransferase [Aliikangiella coralliicola]
MNIEKARFNMIEQQVKPWKVLDEKLLGAMATIPREKFVPESYRNLAYADIAIPLGHNQSMLTPRELARMIQGLELTGVEKVLEIGCGSGYASALLSKLASKVYSVDIISDFVKNSRKRLRQLAFSNVEVEEVDAADGWLAHAPYDAILITSALPHLTETIKRSLSAKGRIATILGSAGSYTATLCKPDEQGQWQSTPLFPMDAKPMINTEQPNQFVF